MNLYRETIQTIGGQFIRVQNALERGDMEKAQEILSGIDTLASDMTFKNLGKREEKANEAEQRRQIADNATQIQNAYSTTGIYQNPNIKEWEMPERVADIIKTPRVSVDSAGNRIVTNWNELTPEQKMELLKNGYNGGGYHAGR